MSIKCPECQRPELAYEASIQEIHAVVNGSFRTVREKLNRLFQKQDIRDQTIRSMHTHKKTHYRKSVPDDKSQLEADSFPTHDVMRGRSRRDFRCSADLPVLLTFTAAKKTFECSTINVSSNGMAVKTPVPLKLAEAMDIALLLPEIGTLRATGIVAWDDEHGECGLKVQCSGHEMRQKLDSWLDSRLPLQNKRLASSSKSKDLRKIAWQPDL